MGEQPTWKLTLRNREHGTLFKPPTIKIYQNQSQLDQNYATLWNQDGPRLGIGITLSLSPLARKGTTGLFEYELTPKLASEAPNYCKGPTWN